MVRYFIRWTEPKDGQIRETATTLENRAEAERVRAYIEATDGYTLLAYEERG